MHKTIVIAIREYVAAVRTKAFIVSIVIMPVLMGGGIVAQKLLKNQVDTTDKKIAVVDRSGMIAPVLVKAAELRNETGIYDKETGKKIRPAYTIEIVPPNDEDPDAQRLELSEKVKNKELLAYVEIGKDVVNPGNDPEAARVAYHAENAALDDARDWIARPINECIRSLRLAAVNLDEATVNRVTMPVRVEALGLVSMDTETGQVKEAKRSSEGAAILVPLIIMFLMFMMIMMGATPLINSVLEEKMYRIAEVLLGSVSPFQLMMGKLFGAIGVSFTIVAVYVLGGTIAAERMGAADFIPYHILPWFFAYQVAAIFMFGAMFVAIGSACNDLKEAQSLMMPVWLVVCIPMFVWFQVLREPLSRFATGLSLFPPCTPMLMLIRQSTPAGIPQWQPWVGLAGVMVFTVITVWVAGRIFRVGILMQGKPPKITELMRWAIRG